MDCSERQAWRSRCKCSPRSMTSRYRSSECRRICSTRLAATRASQECLLAAREQSRLLDRHRVHRAPVRVVGVEFKVPFGRGPVRNTADHVQRKVNVRPGANALIRKGGDGRQSDIVVILGVALQVDFGAAPKGHADGDLLMHAPERAEVVANVPAVALEPELVVGLIRPDQAGSNIGLRVVDRESTTDREVWQNPPRDHRIDAEVSQLRLDGERAEARVLWPTKSESERRINSQAVAEPGFVWSISVRNA